MNIFINNLDDGTEQALFKFANNTKLELAIYTTDGCAAVQRNLYRLEKLPIMNLMGFNRGKCQVLHLEGNSPVHQYRLQAKHLESSSAEKDWGGLVDIKLINVPVAAKANSLLGSTRKSADRKLKEMTQLW